MFCTLTDCLSKVALNGLKVFEFGFGGVFSSENIFFNLIYSEGLAGIVFSSFAVETHALNTSIRLDSPCSRYFWLVCVTHHLLTAVVSARPARDDLRASQCVSFVLPTGEEEVFLKTATHNNLNLES